MKQLGDGSRLIALDYYDRVEITDVEGRWGSQMGFTFGYCDQVRANRGDVPLRVEIRSAGVTG